MTDDRLEKIRAEMHRHLTELKRWWENTRPAREKAKKESPGALVFTDQFFGFAYNIEIIRSFLRAATGLEPSENEISKNLESMMARGSPKGWQLTANGVVLYVGPDGAVNLDLASA